MSKLILGLVAVVLLVGTASACDGVATTALVRQRSYQTVGVQTGLLCDMTRGYQAAGACLAGAPVVGSCGATAVVSGVNYGNTFVATNPALVGAYAGSFGQTVVVNAGHQVVGNRVLNRSGLFNRGGLFNRNGNRSKTKTKTKTVTKTR